ncbi:MAG: heterodisulfide reductase-related iron-sulfur binding cluster [Thermoprotei archaeon]
MADLRGVLEENLKKYGFPFPLSKSECHKWSDLPKSGGTLFYTSCMYQIATLTKSLSKFVGVADKLSAFGFLASKLVKPAREDLDRASRIFNKMVKLLRASGVSDLFYLYDDEPYSGAVLLELGYLDLFEEHAKRVYSFFKERGIKRIVTVDPHTHNALTRYGEFVPGFDIEVRNVYEFVKEAKAVTQEELTIHDSCLYSRFLNLRDKYRGLIARSGLRIKEDFLVTGKDNAFCCGYPIEVVDKDVSESIAELRAKSLKSLANKAIVVCPMCYAQLRDKIEVVDLMEVVE